MFRVFLTGSVVSMLPGLWAGWSGFPVSAGARDFCLNCPNRLLWGPPTFLHSQYQVTLPEVKRSGRDVDHSTSSSTGGRNECRLHLYPSLMHLWCERGKQVLNLYDPHRKKRGKGNFFMQRVLPRLYTDQPVGAL